MPTTEIPGSAWTDAVSEAARHVDQRIDAQATAGTVPRRDRGRRTVTIATVILLLSLSGNAWLLLQPSVTVAPLVERENLIWSVVDAAERIEDFRVANSRLPTRDEITPELGDAVSYRLLRDRYVVSIAGPTDRLSYDSSVPLDDWVAATSDGDEAPAYAAPDRADRP